MNRFQSGGLSLAYEIHGRGHPIILAHGWGSSTKGNWVDTGWVDALAPHRQIIGLDCRGHGHSDKPHDQSRYSYRAMSRDVIALMDHLDLEQADFLGYSMGSFMGAALLGTDSHRFSSMILGGIGNETGESIAACEAIARALRAESAGAIENDLERAYRRFVESDPANDLEALALSALQMWPEGFPLDVAGPEVNAANTPVLIVNGTNDLPYADSNDELVAKIPNARLSEIPDADHLSAVTHPAFKRAVIEFLEER